MKKLMLKCVVCMFVAVTVITSTPIKSMGKPNTEPPIIVVK